MFYSPDPSSEPETGGPASGLGRPVPYRSDGRGTPQPPGLDGAAEPCGSVVDLFCGVGGLSHGFRQEGFEIAGGVDSDENCRYAFEYNNEAPFIRHDVSLLDGEEVEKLFTPGIPSILVGCAPCQPFSVYNQKNSDPQWQLLEEFARIISQVRPSVVSMENVPRLMRFRKGKVFDEFVETLEREGYHVRHEIAFAPDYGVPQQRSRLVLLASLRKGLELGPPTHSSARYETVANAIGDLPRLAAGECDARDLLHRCSRLSPLNLNRIRASTAGGSWRDWDNELVSDCHRKETGRGYGSVYGRMSWYGPAPTITTQFYGFGNGRFGHPEQDRALSLREGAILQSFPPDYDFVKPGASVQFKTLGRMIGNAVPVLLARAIARSIRFHLGSHVR